MLRKQAAGSCEVAATAAASEADAALILGKEEKNSSSRIRTFLSVTSVSVQPEFCHENQYQ